MNIQLDDLPSKSYDPHVARGLWKFLRPYWKPLFASLILMFLSAMAGVAGPYFVKIALDSGLGKGGSVQILGFAVLGYLGVAIVQWASIFFRVNIMSTIAQSIIYDIRKQMFEHLQKLSLSFFNRYSVGRITVRVINDVTVLRDFILWAMLAIFRDIFTLAGILTTMLIMDTRLSLMSFSVLPIMILVTVVFRRRAREYYRKTRSAISWVNSVLAENINGVRVVQSFSREDKNYAFFRNEVNRNNLDINLKAVRLASFFFPSIDFLGSIAMAIVIWLGGVAALGESITPGVLVAFVLYIGRFFEPISDLSQRYDAFQSMMASGERILNLMASTIEVQNQPGAIVLPHIQGEVQFEHVDFHYSDDPAPVLENIHLHIQPGETVALVGKTGAGKSTMIKLLARFNDPSEGKVLVDGYDLRAVTQASLRSQMGIVLQDPFLFAGTVKENIRFGRLEASDAEVEAAAIAVGADEFIRKLKNGYDTGVEEGGVILSVGQRQLVSFARALLANPRILILDEATSSIDTQTEQIIQDALGRLLKGRTSFVIAHRLSTIINAQRIVVIQDGKIVEEGTHTELLARGTEYFRLYSMRFEEKP